MIWIWQLWCCESISNNIELSEIEYMKFKKVFNGIARLYVYIK